MQGSVQKLYANTQQKMIELAMEKLDRNVQVFERIGQGVI